MKQQLIKSLALVVLLALGLSLNAIAKTSKEITVKTSICCPDGKAKIEKGLKKLSGIESVKANVEAKNVLVKYDADKTNPDDIRKSIVKLGYDADDLKANKKDCNDKNCSKTKSGCKASCDKSKTGCCSSTKDAQHKCNHQKSE